MKILHTSDWHLGHTLYNYSRSEEQLSMLEQMAALVAEHRPDVFLICGDVYHTPQPSAAVQTMLTEALVCIHEACPEMVVVMTAGNHDSGTRHEVFRTPWRALNVYAIGQLERENIDRHIIELPGRGFVAAVPYCSERSIPEGFFQTLLDEIERRNEGGRLPVVMTAHTTVRGCDYAGHEQASESVVGGIDAMDVESMGRGYDYLALGHIHREQFVHSGRHNVRYCGTPLPVSFDERFAHSVSLVDIASHGEQPRVEKIAIENPHPLVTLPTEGYATWDEARLLLAQFPNDNAAYIRLNVEVDDYLPAEAQVEAAKLTEGKMCRFCCINARRRTAARAAAKTLSVQEFQAEQPIDIARLYAEDVGIDFDDDMQRMFEQTMAALEAEERE